MKWITTNITKLPNRPTIAIAGASGFIGSKLLLSLVPDYHIIGLTRSQKPSQPGLEWRQCDLYSLLQAEHALSGADYAFYLVHSMMPMARLSQGNFEDMDLILADNFARAAAHAGVKQIIYLGGIIPDTKELSPHLHSRLEVEHVLGSHGVPVTALRASLIIGARGSSFQIVEKLVRRLPFLLCPKWCSSKTQPIALDDVISILKGCIGKEWSFDQEFDIGGQDIISYIELLGLTAKVLGLKRHIKPFPLMPATLSAYLAALIVKAPKELIMPLVQSLKDPMVAHELTLQERLGITPLKIEQAIQKAMNEKVVLRHLQPTMVRQKYTRSLQYSDGIHHPTGEKDVRSVQRLSLPMGKDAIWLAEKYTLWLPRFFKTWLKVEVSTERKIAFYFSLLPLPLLILEYSESRSTPDRTLFYIRGGLLAKKNTRLRGRLEFREVLGDSALVAIHDYSPRLPWFIYNYSQALIHLWVMGNFQKYLKKLDVRY